jgi:hypothetical protein
MATWRGDVGTSGVIGGTVSAIVGVAAVVVAVVALANSQRHEALLAIGISAVAVFVSAVLVFFVRKRINFKRAERYLREERGIIADMKAALEEVQKDLEAPSEHRDLLADHIGTVRHIAVLIKQTNGINVIADLVADNILHGTFRENEPEASSHTVSVALINCEKAEYGYGIIENRLNSLGWRQYVPRLAKVRR